MEYRLYWRDVILCFVYREMIDVYKAGLKRLLNYVSQPFNAPYYSLNK